MAVVTTVEVLDLRAVVAVATTAEVLDLRVVAVMAVVAEVADPARSVPGRGRGQARPGIVFSTLA